MSGFYSAHQVNGAARGCVQVIIKQDIKRTVSISTFPKVLESVPRDWYGLWHSRTDLRETVNPFNITTAFVHGGICNFLKKPSIAFIRESLVSL